MDNAQHKLLFYVLKRLVGTILPSIYILWITGVFESGMTQESFKMSIWLVIGVLAVTFIKDYVKHVMDENIVRPKQRGVMVGLQGLIPWIIVLVIATAIKVGFANMYEHLIVITVCELGAHVFAGFEEYYRLLIKEESK